MTPKSELQPHQIEALRLLGKYTHGMFVPYNLAGSQNAAIRAKILGTLLQKDVPQKNAGITALTLAMHELADIDRSQCAAVREHSFAVWACDGEF